MNKDRTFSGFPVIFPLYKYTPPSPPATTVLKVTAGASKVTSGSAGILFIASSSQGQSFIKMFQLVDILQYMNLELPQTTKDFFTYFEGDPLEMLPNPMENESYEEGCSLKY